MKFELKLNKEVMVEAGKGAGKIGKAILVEGTKAVALKSANAVITQVFDRESGGVSELKLDDYLRGGKKKEKEPKKGLFSFKKKTNGDEEILEAEVDIEFTEVEDTKAEDVVVEPTKVKTKKAK